VGTKAVVASGLSLIAVGLGLLSRTTVYGGYTDALPLFILIGLGTGLVLAPSIESVLGSLPRQEAGVGSATSDTALQLGGALGVAVLGTALNIRYQSRMTPLLAHEPIPGDIRRLILGSFGGALGVAQHVGGNLGAELADVARRSFVSGMDLGLVVGAAVVGVAGVVVIAVLPNRAPDHRCRRGPLPPPPYIATRRTRGEPRWRRRRRRLGGRRIPANRTTMLGRCRISAVVAIGDGLGSSSAWSSSSPAPGPP
jgi:hypothetical protein